MKMSARIIRCIVACVLVLGLVPTVSFAEDESVNDPTGGNERLFNGNQTKESEAEDSDSGAFSTASSEEFIQPLSDIQEGPQVLAEGDFGEENTLHWVYKDDASLTISGTGAMPDYTEDGGQPWNAYLRTIEKLIIEEDVESIGAYAFYEADYLAEFSFAESLVEIGDYAFSRCDGFDAISLPDGIKQMGSNVFAYCSELKSCHLPAALDVVAAHTFSQCAKLEQVEFPPFATRIETCAFYYCRALTGLDLPKTLVFIAESAFWTCTVHGDVVIPGSLQSAGSQPFFVVRGTITFEHGVTGGVSGIMNNIDCDYVSYPSTLEIAPKGREVKRGYMVAEDNPNNVSLDGCLFSKASGGVLKYDDKQAVLVGVPLQKSGELVVPEGVREIGNESLREFQTAFSITSLHIPASVEVIGDTLRASKLQSISVAAENGHYASRDGILFNKDMTELIRSPRMHRFDEQYVVPDSVKVINGNAFYDSKYLSDVRLSSNITSIEGGFTWCDALASIYIPRSVTSIRKDSFTFGRYPTRNGYTIFYEGSQEEWDAIAINGFSDAYDLTQAADYYHEVAQGGQCKDGLLYYIGHDGVLNVVPDEKAKTLPITMKDYTADGGPWVQHEGIITSVTLSEQITNIGANAFKGCTQLQEATIPFSVTSVGGAAFAGCPKLASVTCMGNGFSVVPAQGDSPSFDVARVQLHCFEGKTGWTDVNAYDEAAKTWNGYSLSIDKGAALPSLSSAEFVWNNEVTGTVRLSGFGKLYQDVGLHVYAESGEDITDTVEVSLSLPKREKPIFWQLSSYYQYSEKSYYDQESRTIKLSNCSGAGDCIVTITPKEHLAVGSAIEKKLVIERDAERVLSGNLDSPRDLQGRYSGKDEKAVVLNLWNQYGELLSDPFEIVSVIDVLSGDDVTEHMAEYGIIGVGSGINNDVVGKKSAAVIFSQLADPRNYTITLKPASDAMRGTVTFGFNLQRYRDLLNVPYSLALTGGSDQIELGTEDQWASAPYRVRVLDGYDDPCWPELSWVVKDAQGNDVTSFFQVDEQGYVNVDPSLRSRLDVQGASSTFTICAQAQGVDVIGYDYGHSDGYRVNLTPLTRTSNELTFAVKVKQPDPEPVTHTATFKVGDEVMGTVTFAEGDASLETPAMPPKANYVGAWKMENGTLWEDFDLTTAKSDITVVGEYAPLNPDEVSDVSTGGDATYENGAITVNLKASASSRNVRVESNSTKPVDVVLVCDQSGSMDQTLGAGKKKVDALKECARGFANSLFENAKKTGADHRIALVGFAYSNDRSGRSINTGLLATNTSASLKLYSQLKDSDYVGALMPINASGQLNGRVVSGISAIKAEGATAADLGLEMAKNIFSLNPVGPSTQAGERERVVVFLTDGTPTSWGTSSNESDKVSNTAAAAIKQAVYIKQSQGAHIYSIGVEGSANAVAEDLYGSKGWKTERGETKFDFNRFLHLVSSNFPAATSMSNKGPGSKTDGFYMPVTNTSALDGIFTNILYSTVYTVEAFEYATMSYVVPDGLSLTLKQEEEMRTALEAQGVAGDDIIVTREGGKTTLTFAHVPVKRILNNGVPEYVASVSFKLSANAGVSGSIGMGSVSADCMGDESIGIISNVSVPSDRCSVVFMLDGQPYEIRDLKEGEAIELPDTDLARWMSLEKLKDEERVASGSSVVFETTSLTRTYAMRWVVDGREKVENLAPGAKIEAPDVASWIPEGYELAGWSPAPPLSMPSANTTCTAVLTESHVHAFTASRYKTGSCTDGMTVHEVCACGEEQTHQEAAKSAHAFVSVLSNDGVYANSMKKLVCKECGYSVEKDMEYEAASDTDEVTVLDLTKLESDVAKPGESADDIEIQYFMDADDGEEYTVTRIDEDDTRTEYSSTVKDGYLWFYPNHFSIYVIGAKDATGVSATDDVTYSDALERLERAAANVPDGPEIDPPDDNGDSDHGNTGDSNSGNGGDGIEGVDGNGSGNGGQGTDQGNQITVVQPLGDAQRNATSLEGTALAATGDDEVLHLTALYVVTAIALGLMLAALRLRKRNAA